MHLMHFRVNFVAYSVYSLPVGRYSSVKKFCTAGIPPEPINPQLQVQYTFRPPSRPDFQVIHVNVLKCCIKMFH